MKKKEVIINIYGEGGAVGSFNLKDAFIDGRGKYRADTHLTAMKVVVNTVNAGHHVESMAEEVFTTRGRCRSAHDSHGDAGVQQGVKKGFDSGRLSSLNILRPSKVICFQRIDNFSLSQ